MLRNKKNKTLDMEETRQVASDLIKGDENLYLSILNYEPVDYENFLNRIIASITVTFSLEHDTNGSVDGNSKF